MSKAYQFLYKVVLPFTITSTMAVVGTAYYRSNQPSPYEQAAKQLGFNGYSKKSVFDKTQVVVTPQAQQEALLKIFYMAGYFEPKKLWEDIVCSKITTNPGALYKSVHTALMQARAYSGDPKKFDAHSLRKNLFKSTDITEQQAKDYMLWTAQNAFNRKVGQERNELTAANWMQQYRDDYIVAARKLRLIDRESPEQLEYPDAWIAGASRIGVLARIIDYHYLLSKGVKINGPTLVLAGERPLWANIDGINPDTYQKLFNIYQTNADIDKSTISLTVGEDTARTEEGTRYMAELASNSGIRLDPLQPFIQYKTLAECPKGYFPGRIYPNYATSETAKLTETLMSNDMLTKFGGNQIEVVHTKAENHERPTTATTGRDAAEQFVQKILAGKFGPQKEFIILFQTNNPYIERQTLATQQEVNKVLAARGLDKQGYKITIEGVGFSSKQDVATIHSELAALVAEKWKAAPQSVSQRDIKELLFQTRKCDDVLPPLPDTANNDTTMDPLGRLQHWFDQHTE